MGLDSAWSLKLGKEQKTSTKLWIRIQKEKQEVMENLSFAHGIVLTCQVKQVVAVRQKHHHVAVTLVFMGASTLLV